MAPALDPASGSGLSAVSAFPAGLAKPRFRDARLPLPGHVLEGGPLDAPRALRLAAPDARIAEAVREPLGMAHVAASARSVRWRIALIASCMLHAGVALHFAGASQAVLMEGAETSGIAFLGNAAEDQLSNGETSEPREPAVAVTMITMLEARPIDASEATAERVPEIADSAGSTASPTETLQPEDASAVQPVGADVAPVVPPTHHALAALPDPVGPAEPATQSALPASAAVPAILATDRPERVDDDNIVLRSVESEVAVTAEAAQKVAPSASETVSAVQAAAKEATESLPPNPVEPDAARPLDATEAARPETVQPSEKLEPETTVAESLTADLAPPLPTRRPKTAPAKPNKAEANESAKRPAAQAKEADKGKPAAKPARAGNRGSSEADARRGRADGTDKGKAASASKGGKSSAAGNAKVSNYPGKVAARLRRALRYPAAAKRQRLRGKVLVSFVVRADGGVGSMRIAAGSGSPILDGAALEAIRRAAPFPAIPPEAGRSSWPFTVPLVFSR